MRKDKIVKLALICVLVGLTVWVVSAAINIGSFKRETWRLGLDLQGGTHLVYQADTSGVVDPKGAVAFVKEIIEKRVNAYGVGEPVIQIQGNDRISVQLPGVSDIDEAKKLIGATANLDFRKLALSEEEGKTTLAAGIVTGDTVISVNDASGFIVGYSVNLGSQTYIIKGVNTINNTITIPDVTGAIAEYSVGQTVTQWLPATGLLEGKTVPLQGKHLKSNSRVVYQDQISLQPAILFEVTPEGAILLEQITTELSTPPKKPLGIFLDDEYISSPTVQDVLTDGGSITGLDLEEARLLAIQLNQGALPLPLTIIHETTVSATLGADSLNKSLIAGLIGLLLVLIFMVAYYRLPGLLAIGALIIYVLIVLSIFKLFPVTLSLAGIAAFVLSIGMAVDANVLIFERMREEIRYGRTVGAAIEAGFDRAWSSIRDSNISTILTCIVLYFFGRALGATVVMGFAITLLIGVLVSMFTAIVITKTFLRMFIGTSIAKKTSLFCSVPEEQETDV